MNVPRSILAHRPTDLTVAWAQRIVDSHVSGAAVSKVEVLSTEIGTTTRVRVAVTHDGPETLPRRWFVKLPSLSWAAWCITALPRLLQTEVRFYQELARSLPVPRPDVLAAESACGRGTTLVLADVSERGARPGVTGEALTVEQTAAVLEQLARVHAHFGDTARLAGARRWLAGPARRWEDRLGTVLAAPLMRRGLRRAGHAVSQALHAPAMRYAFERRRVMRFLAKGPRTLVHHDCHSGNLFWKNAQPGLLDWQLVRIGDGIGDVAYLLATALEPATRRAHETGLLERYRLAMAEHGVVVGDPTCLWERYRAHLAYPFEAMVVTLAVGGLMERESNLELIRRAAAAVEDLEAFAVPRE